MVGTFFLWQALQSGMSTEPYKTNADGERIGPHTLELLCLGLLMFIPGSYHVVVAVMAYLEADGYSFRDVSAYESDAWHNDEDY